MVIDTSAIAAIRFSESDAQRLEALIAADPVRLISAATLVEATIVVESRDGSEGGREMERWLYRIKAEVVPVDSAQAHTARGAWRKFGKGRHPAGLNFGDCFSYALAVTSGEPLLFIGDDFPKTDVKSAGL